MSKGKGLKSTGVANALTKLTRLGLSGTVVVLKV